MAEFVDTARGLRQMPGPVAAADAATRTRWVADPDTVEAEAAAAEEARVTADYAARVAEARRTNTAEPPPPPKPLDDAAQRAMAAAASSLADRIEAARLAALAAPAPPTPTPQGRSSSRPTPPTSES